MRPIERIDNFIRLVDLSKLSERWQLEQPLKIISRKAFTYWKENPDQRIGQVLINLNIIPDQLMAWNDEEEDILRAQGIPEENILFWVQHYDKNEFRLSSPQYKLIIDIESDHINAIFDFVFKRGKKLNDNVIIACLNTLKRRDEPTEHIEKIIRHWNS